MCREPADLKLMCREPADLPLMCRDPADLLLICSKPANLLTCCWCVENLLTYDWCVLLVYWEKGSIFQSKIDIYSPPPSENDIFPPLATRLFSTSIMAFLILPYFTIVLPFDFPFSHFSPFFLFFYISPFVSSPFHIFFPKWHRLTFSRGGGGLFSNKWAPYCEHADLLSMCREPDDLLLCEDNLMTSCYL